MTSVKSENDVPPVNKELLATSIRVHNEVITGFSKLNDFLEGDRDASEIDAHRFVVVWNAFDGGAKSGTVDKWTPRIVHGLSMTMFAVLHGDRSYFVSETLPFLRQWIEDFKDAELWRWLGVIGEDVFVSGDDDPGWSMLDLEAWGDEMVSAATMIGGGTLAIRGLRVHHFPWEVIRCVDYIDVPPGTSHQDVAYLLIEQLLELANRKSEVIDGWRRAQGSTELMSRLRKRLRVELESLRVVTAAGLHGDLSVEGSKGAALMAERRRTSGIPQETRDLKWKMREIMYGKWCY